MCMCIYHSIDMGLLLPRKGSSFGSFLLGYNFLLATSSLLVPGLTILAVYRTEIEETDENDDYYYVDYISALKWKGIGLVGAGGFFDFVVLSIWLRERFVTKRFGSTPTEEEIQTYAGR